MGEVVDKMKSFATVLMSAIIFLLFLYSVSGKHFLIETEEKLKSKNNGNNKNIRPKTGVDYRISPADPAKYCFGKEQFKDFDDWLGFKYLVKKNLVKITLDKVEKEVEDYEGSGGAGDYRTPNENYCINRKYWKHFLENLVTIRSEMKLHPTPETDILKIVTTGRPRPSPPPSVDSGAIIAGGDATFQNVEVFNPDGKKSCDLNVLPAATSERYKTSMCGNLLCSMNNGKCAYRNEWTWDTADANLKQKREGHLC